jgi:DinB superfamily
MSRLDVYLERTGKRVFAGAIEWPGLDRGGKDDDDALAALAAAIPRYATVLAGAEVAGVPSDRATLDVVEEVEGDAGTEFGIPAVGPEADRRPARGPTLKRLTAILEAAWDRFDAAVDRAGDRELRKGPRGGGRDVRKMLGHVAEAEAAYSRQIGGRPLDRIDDPRELLARARDEAREALPAIARGEPLHVGARRKAPFWTPRYYVRRSAWHSLDHAWEIEDRLEA